MANKDTPVPLSVVREYLGARAEITIRAALEPRLDSVTIEAARRYVTNVSGDRIRRLRDRAAFAAAMAHFVRKDAKLRRDMLRLLANEEASARQGRRQRASEAKPAGRTTKPASQG